MIAPYFRFYPGSRGAWFIKYFGSLAEDRGEFIFNNTVWTGMDIRLYHHTSLAVEGTLGSIDEANIQGMEYTGTIGMNILITEKTALKYRFHYTYGETANFAYKRIKNGIVFDLRL